MINDRLSELRDYPFGRLNTLLDGIDPAPGAGPNGAPIIMSIGEPGHAFPDMVTKLLADNAALWRKYPPIGGTADLRAAIADWLSRRYELQPGMVSAEHHVLPVAGTREALFTIALAAVPTEKAGKRPVALIPDPFYQVYVGAAIMAGAEPVFVPTTPETGFLPDFAALPDGYIGPRRDRLSVQPVESARGDRRYRRPDRHGPAGARTRFRAGGGRMLLRNLRR